MVLERKVGSVLCKTWEALLRAEDSFWGFLGFVLKVERLLGKS